MNRNAIATGGEVVLYEAPNGEVRLDVRLERESVWLSLDQIASLFRRDKSVIFRHLRNVFASRELIRKAVVAKNATARKSKMPKCILLLLQTRTGDRIGVQATVSKKETVRGVLQLSATPRGMLGGLNQHQVMHGSTYKGE